MAFGGEFAETPDDEQPGPAPLPPEDRLWRHPSELGSANPALPLDPVAVRRRWLLSEPSRASAWSAGLAGALLATGLVALGTHLAGAMIGHSPSQRATSSTLVAAAAPSEALGGGATPFDAGMGASLRSALERVGVSVTSVTIDNDGQRRERLGIVVRSDGVVLTSASGMSRSATLTVTLHDGETYVGSLLGTDPGTGLAVVRVQAPSALPMTPLATTVTPGVGDVALAVTAPGAARYTWGTIRHLDTAPAVGGTALVDAISTDVPATTSPLGSPVLDPAGHLVGVVTAHSSTGAVVVPAWLAGPVTDDLIDLGVVAHGWLGINGSTVSGRDATEGVRLAVVSRGGAAARAGLRAGDEILSVDGARVTNLAALRGRLYTLHPGSRALVVADRAGTRVSTTVVLDADPSN